EGGALVAIGGRVGPRWRGGGSGVVGGGALVGHDHPVEAPGDDEPEHRGEREGRVEELGADRQRPEAAGSGREVLHKLPLPSAASSTSASRFTPRAIDLDEIDAPEMMSMSLPGVIGSVGFFPLN